ncbi:MAG TPA: PP2C family protein-serine/threonine phosphatase [Terracidiphilus sp.]|nr:PP2C family protein-serine/threonine phosphatase [Terracidiphilus sp.]
MPRACFVFSWALILLGVAPLDRAQAIVAHGANGPAHLDGPWLLSQGDPPGGKSAATDPRPGQAYMLGTGPIPQQGPKIIWLRATVTSDESLSHPALLLNPNAGDCQVFVNGQKAADCSDWPRTTSVARRWLLVHLPAGPAQIAIRLVGPYDGPARVPRHGDVLLGNSMVLERIRTATDAAHLFRLLPQSLLCVGELLGAMILLLAFRNDPRGQAFLWFAAFLLLDGSTSLESVFGRAYPLLPGKFGFLTDALGMIGRYAPLIGFIAAFTRVRLNRWVRGYQILLLVIPVLIGLPYLIERVTWLPRISSQTFGVVLLVVEVPFVVGSLGFLSWKWRSGNTEAGLLLPSFLLASIIELLGVLMPRLMRFHVLRFGFDFDDLSVFFFLVSIGPVLLFRYRRVNLEHAYATAELEAAREIQQRLVPNSIPTIAGCRIEAAYLPAQEVGGDFYQILSRSDGSVVIAVGDVSGKGLKAAMTGVLAIGSLRTLAFEGLGPGAILMRLNSELVRAGNGGFVTCFCGVLDVCGDLHFANAGHLAPFRNGREIEVAGTLPLGIDAKAVYDESTLTLDPGDHLTLLSDGVVEAKNATGELFGFERASQISGQTAQSIAEQAQRFGQTDDITVLTLNRLALA